MKDSFFSRGATWNQDPQHHQDSLKISLCPCLHYHFGWCLSPLPGVYLRLKQHWYLLWSFQIYLLINSLPAAVIHQDCGFERWSSPESKTLLIGISAVMKKRPHRELHPVLGPHLWTFRMLSSIPRQQYQLWTRCSWAWEDMASKPWSKMWNPSIKEQRIKLWSLFNNSTSFLKELDFLPKTTTGWQLDRNERIWHCDTVRTHFNTLILALVSFFAPPTVMKTRLATTSSRHG